MKKSKYKLAVAAAAIGLAMAVASCQPLQQPAAKIQDIANPAAAGARLPRLASLPGGGILMSWVEPLANGHTLKFSVFRGGRWVRQGEVARGSGWFINWSDFPSVVAIDKSFWVAHWLVKQTGGRTYDYDIAMSISTDAGATWSTPKPPHRERSAGEHGFAAIFPVDGDAGIIWLEGGDHLEQMDHSAHSAESGNFSLRYRRIHHDGGIDAEQVLDDNTCTCCWPTVAVTSTGPVAAWRSRTNDEMRDHRVARMRDGKWSAPMPLGAEGWEIAGCPVNGPMLAARGMQVVAAWFTAQDNRPRVRAAFSSDGGQSFGQPVEVDEAGPSGRVGIVWSDDRTAIISWITAPDAVTKKSGLALRKLFVDGTTGPVQRTVEISSGRDAGVPQLIANESGLILAWTGAAPGHGIHTAFVPLDALGND